MTRLLPGLLASLFLIVGCQGEPDARPEPAEPAPEGTPAEVVEAVPPVDCELTVGWDPWEPYSYSGAGGSIQGLDIDLVVALAEHAGCELEFLQGDWAGLLRMIQAGDLDLLLGATQTPEREQFAHFSEAYRDEEFRLYVLESDQEQHANRTLEELLADGFRLGVTQGYVYSTEVRDLQADTELSEQFVEAAVGELNFTHLLDYRIDGFLEDPFVAAAIQRRRNWGQEIIALDLDFGSGPVHLMFSQASVDESIVERFNQALGELRESGRYDEIVEGYLH